MPSGNCDIDPSTSARLIGGAINLAGLMPGLLILEVEAFSIPGRMSFTRRFFGRNGTLIEHPITA
jgi:hypothetical protein